MLDALMEVKDEKGETLEDEEIIDIMLMYLNAGHESSAHTTMWATIFLQQHPHFLQKAKAEQERIVKERSTTKKGLTLVEIREMKYLSKVIDETLRLVTFSLTVFREALTDVSINGYVIPKGWKILVWFRSIHLDPQIYPNPKEFNPSRWDHPFGFHEIDNVCFSCVVFFRLDRVNPESRVLYLPHTRPADNCLARIKRHNTFSTQER
ncbi:hypothetical protein Gotri_027586 [Gossypium trilobum]|uniref:Uncharacterized protein n=1 Tax=Gossypium trilobum TaxID=34281 RepID=A0A7J9FTQ1_9ROSI|nr:hypothetical protein [Gossypium trilobum]